MVFVPFSILFRFLFRSLSFCSFFFSPLSYPSGTKSDNLRTMLATTILNIVTLILECAGMRVPNLVFLSGFISGNCE